MSDKKTILDVIHTFENLSEGEELRKLFFKDNISSTEYYISIRKAYDENLGYIIILESIYAKTGAKTRLLFKNFSTPDELTSNINLCKETLTEFVANVTNCFIEGLNNIFGEDRRLVFTFLGDRKVECFYSKEINRIHISYHVDGMSSLSTTTKEDFLNYILYYFDMEWFSDYWSMFDDIADSDNHTTVKEETTCINNSSEKLDAVNHPAHYNRGNIECIDAMISAFGKEEVIIFCKLNAFKYIWRAGQKSSDGTEDIEKAIWYLNKGKELADSCMSR